jgi:tRNA threonylcarbamoyladenosine biosynthesis protein TsaB
LRIGMATAKGLCFAGDIPLWTVSSLAALAFDAGAAPGRVVVPVLDAKKGEVFAGLYRVGHDGAPEAHTADRVLAPAAMAELLADLDDPLLLGTGVTAYPTEIASLGELAADVRSTPSAEAVARIALTANEAANLATAAPTYVRLSEAELKWRTHIP